MELESSQFGDQAVAVLLNFPPDGDPIYCDQVYGSCDGLVLMLDSWLNCSLVNPSTREVRKLPESPFKVSEGRRGFTDYGFGYDSSIDDYKIVSVCNYNNVVCVYALKANSWRRIENIPYKYLGCRRQSAAFVCGARHWLASNGTDDVIVAFSLADEKFRTVPSPGCIGDELCVLGGCLCVLVQQTHRVDVWVMKKYGVRDSWTKFTVTYHDSFQPWRPLSLSSTGQILFDTEQSQLVVFNPWEEKCKELVVQGCPKWVEGGTYVASLVSP